MTLTEAIKTALEMRGDNNGIGVTLHPHAGWHASYGTLAYQEDEILIINQEALNDWNRGMEWHENAICICADWIQSELRDWLSADPELSGEQIEKLLEAAR
jgi:hypothetical protein